MADIGTIHVPDEGPEDAKILFVGEAPGSTEEVDGRPFVGEAGNFLTTVLGRNGIPRESVRLANLCHYRPRDNKFDYLLDTPQLQDGIKALSEYIQSHRPTVIAALGNWPLYYLTGKQGKKAGSGILNWRGSILTCSLHGVTGQLKVIPTLHPAYLLRDRKTYPIFDQDIKRVVEDSAFPELRLPERKYVINPTGLEREIWVEELLKARILGVDVETFGPYLACVGFAPSADLAVCFVNDNSLGFDSAIRRLLSCNIPKVAHFSHFDKLYLITHGYPVVNLKHDTMVLQHVMWPELPRALKYITSIYTREPYYKDEGKESFEDKKSWNIKSISREKLWTYNCKDCCTMVESLEKMLVELEEGPPEWKRFYEFEMEMLDIANEMALTGIKRDEKRRQLLEAAVMMKYAEHQALLEKVIGSEINVGSHKKIHFLLYDVLGLPVQRHYKSHKVTADDDAMIRLIGICKDKIETLKTADKKAEWQRRFLVVKMIMLIRGHRKLLSSYICVKMSEDGRGRSIFKVPATETGRWAAEKFVDDTGLNFMTLPRDPVEVPDDLTEDNAGAILRPEVLLTEDDPTTESASDSEWD
jgi:uracil-DNA glycosylase family 4